MSRAKADKAVVLARGLGTRMREADDSVRLTERESAVADSGIKAMIPIDRPFLDYVLSGLADAGYRHICLVIGPGPSQVRDYYERLEPRRLRIEFALQAEPRGTADAVAAAEAFAAGQPVTVVNGDNYYPVEALRALREDLRGSGLAAFDRDGLVGEGNVPPERIGKFAVVQADDAGRLVRILEKPEERDLQTLVPPIYVSMNCWRLGPAIFPACRSIQPSSRGELELPDAVQYAIDRLGESFTVLKFHAPVLDLSSRADIPAIKARLAGTEAHP